MVDVDGKCATPTAPRPAALIAVVVEQAATIDRLHAELAECRADLLRLRRLSWARDCGRAACHAGQPIAANPYPADAEQVQEHSAWREGWTSADNEDRVGRVANAYITPSPRDDVDARYRFRLATPRGFSRWFRTYPEAVAAFHEEVDGAKTVPTAATRDAEGLDAKPPVATAESEVVELPEPNEFGAYVFPDGSCVRRATGDRGWWAMYPVRSGVRRAIAGPEGERTCFFTPQLAARALAEHRAGATKGVGR